MSTADSSSVDVASLIDRDALVELTLDICNIDSAGPTEGQAAERVATWMTEAGFGIRRIGLRADRYNVLGTWRGTGGGYSLIFNSHLDTAVRLYETLRVLDPDADIHHKAWREGEELVGEGVVNDKGPMAAFLIAAKSLKLAGVELKGDVLLSAAIGETSHEPADGPPGEMQETLDLGTRFLITHGGVADFALVAEGTGFSVVSVEAGMAWYKLSWFSKQPDFYTPYLPARTTASASPNMLVRAAAAVGVLERWADGYSERYAYRAACGTVIPKAQVCSIRSGHPTQSVSTPQIASLWLGAFTPPGLDPLALRDELASALRTADLPASEIELYMFRRGYEASGAEPLIEAVTRAHLATFSTAPPEPPAPTCSMWRDVNSFNELGIPAITYGPRSERHAFRKSLTIDSLYNAAVVYARTMLDLCNQDKPGGS
jgi:acetylornithine deacetylase/succinyl-diaminopimelate desuccinylase-like protein